MAAEPDDFDQRFSAETATDVHHFITDDIRIARRIWRFMAKGWTSEPELLLGAKARQEIRLIHITAPISALAAAGIEDQCVGPTGVSWRECSTVTCLARRNGRFALRR